MVSLAANLTDAERRETFDPHRHDDLQDDGTAIGPEDPSMRPRERQAAPGCNRKLLDFRLAKGVGMAT